MTKNAIIHVENTENIIEFAQYLHSAGWNILSANKTEEILLNERIPVIHESGLTINGLYVNETSQLIRRILSSKYSEDDELSEEQNENNIFIVCMNLIPSMDYSFGIFKDKDKEKIEAFHLSSILRNCFSNFPNLLILSDPSDYKEAIIQLRTNRISMDFRLYLAAKALNLISALDAGISATILQKSKYSFFSGPFLNFYMTPYKKFMVLPNGANAHQKACIYKSPIISGALNGFPRVNENKISYNIVSDISFAWERISTLYEILKNQYTVNTTNSDGYDFVTQFTPLTGTVFMIAVKFNCIVGAALSTNVLDSFNKTYTYDLQHISQVVLACSAVVDEASAAEIVKGDFAAVVAPAFTAEAKEILAKNEKIQLIPSAKVESSKSDAKFINGGLLVQKRDDSLFTHWNIRTKNRPSQFKIDQMAFGMLLAMGARSYNAILLKNNAIVGVAQGCTSTFKALQIVLADARMRLEKFQEISYSGFGENSSVQNQNNENYRNEGSCIGDVLICDSVIEFCQPMKDLIDSGITAIIQTGGSRSDDEFTNYCDERGIVMVFTNMTHISF